MQYTCSGRNPPPPPAPLSLSFLFLAPQHSKNTALEEDGQTDRQTYIHTKLPYHMKTSSPPGVQLLPASTLTLWGVYGCLLMLNRSSVSLHADCPGAQGQGMHGSMTGSHCSKSSCMQTAQGPAQSLLRPAAHAQAPWAGLRWWGLFRFLGGWAVPTQGLAVSCMRHWAVAANASVAGAAQSLPCRRS